MKRISLFALVLCSCASQRGAFLDRGLYNNSPFVTAVASSPDEARERALAAIPKGFEIDQDFQAPVLTCGLPGEAPNWDESRHANSHCDSGKYRVDVALLPKEGLERDAILRTRQDGIAALEASERRATDGGEPNKE